MIKEEQHLSVDKQQHGRMGAECQSKRPQAMPSQSKAF